jgi:Domain of unknown function (DUF4281)
MWDGLFGFVNVVALIGWALLVFLPRHPLTHSAILFLGIGLLCLIYTTGFALIVSGSIDPGGQPGAGGLDFTSIAGVRALFLSDGGVVVGWTHYLAFDLFTGLWIARDADAKGFSRLTQVPFLATTLIAGPIGLLFWLIVREARARKLGRG